eukprot:TCONS_00040434-protein
MIVIQTDHQKYLANEFSKNGVCCDSTHKTNGYDFSLNTLLVVDEFGEGQPIAWCLTNHETYEFISFFFEHVKRNNGNMTPAWFMSDLASQYHEAFENVFQITVRWLWCTWHVDRAWKAALIVVKDLELQAELYKMFRTILEETNEDEFLRLEGVMATKLESLKSRHDTKDLANYFESSWRRKRRNWGYAYRLGDGINTNMFVEAFHRVFKYQYLNGKQNKRLDKAVFNLVKYSRNSVFHRLIKLTKGKNTYRSDVIYDRHKRSLTMATEVNQINDNKWSIVSENHKTKRYEIKLVQKDKCREATCRLMCTDCQFCIHQYTCTCIDSLMNSLSCKHVHYLHQLVNLNSAVEENLTDEQNIVQSPLQRYVKIKNDINTIIQSLPNDENIDNVAKIKRNIEQVIGQLTLEYTNAGNAGNLKTLLKDLNSARYTFASLEKNKLQPYIAPNKTHWNKNIEKQPRFFSTKKKRKRNRCKLAKPTAAEKKSLFSQPINLQNEGQKEPDETPMVDISSNQNEGQGEHNAKPLMINSSDQHPDGDSTNTIQRTPICDPNKVNHLLNIRPFGLRPKIQEIPDEIINYNIEHLESRLDKENWEKLKTKVQSMHDFWRCYHCKCAWFANMVECEECGKWFHWQCVFISNEAPENWICQQCAGGSKKKKRTSAHQERK